MNQFEKKTYDQITYDIHYFIKNGHPYFYDYELLKFKINNYFEQLRRSYHIFDYKIIITPYFENIEILIKLSKGGEIYEINNLKLKRLIKIVNLNKIKKDPYKNKYPI